MAAVVSGMVVMALLSFGVLAPGAGAGTKPLQGLCFSPYLQVAPGVEMTSTEVGSLMDKVAPYSGGLRMFCSTGMWAGMPAMAKSKGMGVAGACDLCADLRYNSAELNGLIAQARARSIDLAIVGDETLSGSGLSERTLIGYINKVKAYGIPTTTSQTYDELLAHPKVMSACSVIVMNIYPFWEGKSAATAVSYINTQYQRVKKAARGKQVIVETGWPSAGQTVGAAVPGIANANAFLKAFIAWSNANAVKYYYFEAFDELWKVRSEGAVGAHWGVWDQNGDLKPGMGAILGTP
ncbi:MAG: glycosyl hydrolase family 17 protein [Candidatus Geothermincolia bacterium]